MIDKAKELAYLLIGRDTGSVDSKCKIITEWLEQNQPEPVVVGLSDEQVVGLAEYINDRRYDHHFESTSESIAEFLKTQTFAQPQQFQPNWDNAPEWANWLAKNSTGEWAWYASEPSFGFGGISTKWEVDASSKKKTVFDNSDWIRSLQQRPKPTQQVEVGRFRMNQADIMWFAVTTALALLVTVVFGGAK